MNLGWVIGLVLAGGPEADSGPPPVVPAQYRTPRAGSGGGTAESAAPAPMAAAPSPAAPSMPTAAPATTTSAAPSAAADEAPRATAAGGTAQSISVAPNAPTLNSSGVTDLLTKAPVAGGVDVQRRNAIVSDPRVRGLRAGQYRTTVDGAPFFPARLDLDSPLSLFDAGSVRDVIVHKGPFTARSGYGLAVIDAATLPAPRYEKDFEAHGRTAFTYQTNGRRNDGLQSILLGGPDWGVRGTFNMLQGNDYRAGRGGPDVAGSYRSANYNVAAGADLTRDVTVEAKAVRVSQGGLEFPGLYFDVRELDTEAYSARLTARDGPFTDLLALDVWYNATAASGDTRNAAKQAFVRQLLATTFNAGRQEDPPFAFADDSTTRFAGRSIGYRLAATWGQGDGPTLTAGTDLNVFGQGLVEDVRFQQVQGSPLIANAGPQPLLVQRQTLPNGNSVNPGLFAEGGAKLFDGVTARIGGRTDWVRSTSNLRRITGNIPLFGLTGEVGPPTSDRLVINPITYSQRPDNDTLGRDFWLLSGFASGEAKLGPYLTYTAAVGYAERAPTLTELYAAGPFIGVLQQGTSRLIGDPNLRKERAIQLEMGVRAEADWVRAGATGFYTWVNDYITFDANATGLGLTQVVYTNTDLATLAGGELFAETDVTDYLTGFGAVRYVQGIDQTHADRRRPADLTSSRRNAPTTTREFASQTEPLPQISPMDARLGLRLHGRGTDPRWSIECSARLVAAQNNVAVSLDELRTPGFTTVDIRGFWQATPTLLLTAGVENVGDVLYREHLDPVAGNRLGVGSLFRPGTNFYFGATLRY